MRAVPRFPCHGGAFAFFAAGSSSESVSGPGRRGRARASAPGRRRLTQPELSREAASDAIVSPLSTSSSESDTPPRRFFMSFLALPRPAGVP